MQTLELEDIQGIILRGYGTLRSAAFLLLEIEDPVAARQWLRNLSDHVMDGRVRPTDACLNIAFTYPGLSILGLSDDALASFRMEFQDGMTATDHRRRILGDVGANTPEHWDWGEPNGRAVHILLMLYAPDDTSLSSFVDSHIQKFARSGVALVRELDTLRLKGRKEHFGFRDGIAQPIIAGYKEGPAHNTVRPGEFVLGYHDEYGAFPPTPTLDPANDPRGLLHEHPTNAALRDFGRNGSYMVFRQLSQNVQAFWTFLGNKTQRADGQADLGACVGLASKMVGRWPSGAPLVKSPGRDNPELQDEDDFTYHATDPHGNRCPIGSHVRRSNPRDSLPPNPGSETSLNVGKRHRIIRRGRAYGAPVSSSMEPSDILSAPPDDAERGLHFICFNTNINRQFEFIQHTWVNNPTFGGLRNEPDPIIGEPDPQGTGATGVFTAQGDPVRRRVTGLNRFVNVRGGSYFFMPGKAAVRYLASLQ